MRVLSGILGVLIIIGGVYCLMTPVAAFASLMWVFALVMLVEGIANVIVWVKHRKEIEGSGWLLAGAIISILFGLLLLGNIFATFIAGEILIYFIAFWFIFIGIARIIAAFKLRKAQKECKEADFNPPILMGLSWGWALAFGILLTLFGLLSLSSPLFLAGFIGIIVGLSIIVAGVNLLGFAFSSNK